MKRPLPPNRRISQNANFEVTHVYHEDGEKYELKEPILVASGEEITFGSIITHYEDR